MHKFQSFNSNRKDWFPLSTDFFPQRAKGAFGGSRGSISATHDENEWVSLPCYGKVSTLFFTMSLRQKNQTSLMVADIITEKNTIKEGR
jgi:hypothetical protein